jgi:alkyl hydroperoxide reductase subunit AhpF
MEDTCTYILVHCENAYSMGSNYSPDVIQNGTLMEILNSDYDHDQEENQEFEEVCTQTNHSLH